MNTSRIRNFQHLNLIIVVHPGPGYRAQSQSQKLIVDVDGNEKSGSVSVISNSEYEVNVARTSEHSAAAHALRYYHEPQFTVSLQ